jgi:hypothetical protein
VCNKALTKCRKSFLMELTTALGGREDGKPQTGQRLITVLHRGRRLLHVVLQAGNLLSGGIQFSG